MTHRTPPGAGHRACLAAALLASLLAATGPAAAQGPGVLRGTVLDAKDGAPVEGAALVLRAAAQGSAWQARSLVSDREGGYRFDHLPMGRYTLSVERLGYRPVSIEVVLERDEPLVVSIVLEPIPFELAALSPRPRAVRAVRSPGLTPPPLGAGEAVPGARAAGIRARQQRFPSRDVRQLSHADMREANTLAEDDVLRAFQRGPGVSTRDDFSADVSTRGAAAGQTVLLFDGIPVTGGLHALGVFSGFNSDMLAAATFEPGVASAALQGGGAGVIAVESRSRRHDGHTGVAALSPASARVTTDGRIGNALTWTLGLRRSYIDALSAVASDLTPGHGHVPYAFSDVTGRIDVALPRTARIEASVFWQNDRLFGDVPDLAYGNEGRWGAHVARASLAVPVGDLVMRHTLGASGFDASLRVTGTAAERRPLHPRTENHVDALIWESRIGSRDGDANPWSIGLRAARERHAYNGPDVDLARLLSPEEFARRGITELTPIIRELERAQLLSEDRALRVALWGEQQRRVSDAIDAQIGLRVETGDRVQSSAVRLAPRIQVRYQKPGSPLSLSAGLGRAWQMQQSIARTDVLRTGLRANEVLVHADDDSPALRSDMATLSAELWRGSTWLLGATAWLRASRDVLMPLPAPGAIDGPRPAVPAEGTAHGLELSARRLEGRVRGFANYSLVWSWLRADTRRFPASEDRRHVANLGVVGDLNRAWLVGATWRFASGAPYTRITLIDTGCNASLGCTSSAPVLHGTPGGQRAPAFASLDLMTEWTHETETWSLAVYGQLRNALGSENAVTYHSSCLCLGSTEGAEARLGDRFDRGLPRLPVIGMRVRF